MEQNIEWYILPARLQGGKKCGSGVGRKQGKMLGLLEESLGLTYLENGARKELEGRKLNFPPRHYVAGNAVAL